MRVALINPLLQTSLQRHRMGGGHLGLAYCAAALRDGGHEVFVIDAKHENLGMGDVIDRIRDLKPAIVGSTAMTHEICHVGELLREVKAIDPKCITVVGGPHGTALPERTLEEFPQIDFVIIGEGERSICELADSLEAERGSDVSGVCGIAYRDQDTGSPRRTADRPWITDLDAMPLPAWELFPDGIGWPVFASRGCPYRCAFCQRVLGSKVRMRSVDNVLAELDQLHERFGVTYVWFQDETFGVKPRWMDEFLTKMEARNERLGFTFHWGCNSRVNMADPVLYARMRKAGCKSVSFGVESGDQAVLDRVEKGIRLDKVREGLAHARAAGLKTSAFFIIGHPGENLRSALRTVRFAPRTGADTIAVGVMVPYPGTRIWDFAKRNEWGYKLLTEDWRAYDKYFGNALELEHLSHRQMEVLQALTYIWFFVRRGRIQDLSRFVRRFAVEARTLAGRILRPKHQHAPA